MLALTALYFFPSCGVGLEYCRLDFWRLNSLTYFRVCCFSAEIDLFVVLEVSQYKVLSRQAGVLEREGHFVRRSDLVRRLLSLPHPHGEQLAVPASSFESDRADF